MKNKILSVIALGFLAIGCENTKQNALPNAYIFNTSLQNDYQNLNATLNKKRIKISFISGAVANNCIEYLAQIKVSEVSGGTNNRIHQREYLTCEAIDLLKPRSISVLPKEVSYGNELANNLILTSYPSSINQESEAFGITLKKLDPTHLKISNYSVVREIDDWTYSLQVVASTDLNNDNIDDLIIWIHDKAKQGSYNTYSTLIVPLYNNNQSLIAIPFEKWNH